MPVWDILIALSVLEKLALFLAGILDWTNQEKAEQHMHSFIKLWFSLWK